MVQTGVSKPLSLIYVYNRSHIFLSFSRLPGYHALKSGKNRYVSFREMASQEEIEKGIYIKEGLESGEYRKGIEKYAFRYFLSI